MPGRERDLLRRWQQWPSPRRRGWVPPKSVKIREVNAKAKRCCERAHTRAWTAAGRSSSVQSCSGKRRHDRSGSQPAHTRWTAVASPCSAASSSPVRGSIQAAARPARHWGPASNYQSGMQHLLRRRSSSRRLSSTAANPSPGLSPFPVARGGEHPPAALPHLIPQSYVSGLHVPSLVAAAGR